ncbi:MAG: RNA polymerase sigma factor [Planctomycetota bacterium]|nr:RNA polymerase sigma factor [Planctomycetota bacterium]
MIDDDEALARLSRLGDREAFEQLVRRTARGLHARLYLDTGDAHQAEDLVQETYLTAWRGIRKLTDPKAFRPWLHSIARNAMLDCARNQSRKKRSGLRLSSGEIEQVDDQALTPPQEIESRSEREQMLEALRSLPDEYRSVLMLRYLGGADYQSIGKELAISNGSLRGLLSRGMALLREKMKEKN